MEQASIDFLKRLGLEIKLERTAQGMYQIELGERAGFTRLYVSQIENTYRHKHNSNVYFKLAIGLNIPLSVLVKRAMTQDSQSQIEIIAEENHNYALGFDQIPEVVTYYSQRLRDEREGRGIDRWEMAEPLGVKDRSIYETEQNLILSPFTRYYDYANHLEIKFYDLIKEAEDFVINNKSK